MSLLAWLAVASGVIIIVALFVAIPKLFRDELGVPSTPPRPSRPYYDDDDGGSSFSYSSQTDWEKFIDSERYSGHSYGDSVSHIVDNGRTYGYNERW